jgi:hypothetical protein
MVLAKTSMMLGVVSQLHIRFRIGVPRRDKGFNCTRKLKESVGFERRRTFKSTTDCRSTLAREGRRPHF